VYIKTPVWREATRTAAGIRNRCSICDSRSNPGGIGCDLSVVTKSAANSVIAIVLSVSA
jgi:hypothetical protein